MKNERNVDYDYLDPVTNSIMFECFCPFSIFQSVNMTSMGIVKMRNK